MARTRVKICGITRVEDARMAALVGADAIGMVFHAASHRNISEELAGEILGVLPPFVTPVGLFVDATTEHILEVCRRLKLRHVQLHGNESPQEAARLVNLRVLKAVHVRAERIAGDLEIWRGSSVCGLILDTASNVPGGAGIANDWTAMKKLGESGAFAGLPPIIAAGGLTPQSVGAVVRDLRPYAVDVSSGVELVRGLKDPGKIREFLAAVTSADAR